MAWRLDENGDIVISGWETGISPNPYDGPTTLNNVNLAVPGEVNIGFPLTANTVSGATLGKPISKAIQLSSGGATNYYILDATGQVFNSSTYDGTYTYLSNGASTTSAQATDAICFWKGYLFKFRNDSIDYWNGTVWVNGWNPATGGSGATSITGTTQHFALVGQDDVLYFCNGSKVGSIMEKAGATFDPTTTSTYTFNTAALTLPSFDIAQSLAEQSTNLLVGGSQNSIYPWDRISPTFRFPIFTAEPFIRKMVTANTNVYVFAGNASSRGRIYVTNGSQADLFFKIPDHILSRDEPYFVWGDAAYHRNNLLFGFEPRTNNGSGTAITNYGVWAVDLETKAFRKVSSAVGFANVIMPSQTNSIAVGLGYVAGLYDGSTNTIYNSSTAPGTGSATVITELIPIGTFLRKKTFRQVEVKLASTLGSGESVAITALYDTGSSVTVGTFNTASEFSKVFPVTFQANQWLQIQAEITGNSVGGVRLREIRLR